MIRGLVSIASETMGASQDITLLKPNNLIESPYLCRALMSQAYLLLQRARGTTEDIQYFSSTVYAAAARAGDHYPRNLPGSQALGNLLRNAIHCTEARANIVLRVALESDEALAISVTDDGIGIHAADLPHVFDRFYRTAQSRSRGIGGTGLGLAITRAIVEAHGGTIDVTSDGLGRGVTVTIRLLPKGVPSASSVNSAAGTATTQAKEL